MKPSLLSMLKSRERCEGDIRSFFESHPNEEYSGHQIAVATDVGPGKQYSILLRMEKAGEITSRWADEPYPRRRLYKKEVTR